MAAAAHDPAFAKKMGIPQSVAREFNHADMMKRRKKKHGDARDHFPRSNMNP